MTDYSDLGIELKLGSGTPVTYTTIAGVTKLDSPELINQEVETTAHNSTYRTFISGNLIEVSEFKATISYDPTVTGSFVGNVCSGIVSPYQIEFPNTETWSFNALIKSFKPSSADAQKPGELTAELTFRPTGTMTVA